MKDSNYKVTHFELWESMMDDFAKMNFQDKQEIWEVFEKIKAHCEKEHGTTQDFYMDDLISRTLANAYVKQTFDITFEDDDDEEDEKEKDEIVEEHMWRSYFPYLFHKYGKKVFRLSEDLVYSLIETKISKIDSFFLELPFKCIYLALPKSIQMKTPEGDRIDGIYITLLKEGEFPSEGRDTLDGDKKVTKILLISPVQNNVDPGDVFPRDTTSGYEEMFFCEGDIFTQIKSAMMHIIKEHDSEDAIKEYCQYTEELTTFVINTILYINSSNRILKKIKPKVTKAKKKNNKKKQKSKLSYYALGRDIVIDNKVKHGVIDLLNHEPGEYQRRTGRWMVKGHPRMQPVGPGRKDRKLIWIDDFEKGDSMAEMIHKDYKVK